MATFPDYVCVLFDGYSESFDPSVLRTEMERGPPKQRVENSQVLMKVSATLAFQSDADVESFYLWYKNDIKRILPFEMTHPRTGETITARFEGGNIGTLVPLATQFRVATRNVVIEYLD